MLLSDFHCKENDRMTGAAHLIQTFWQKTRLLWFTRLLPLLISGNIIKKSDSSALLQSFCHFPHNENLMRTLNTTSLKCCLPSTDAIDKQKKFIYVYEGSRSPYASMLQGFGKKMVGYLSNRVIC